MASRSARLEAVAALITGPDGLDCGSDCRGHSTSPSSSPCRRAPPPARVSMAGSGVCGSNPTCRFAVGPVTSLQARFVEAPPPPPPPPPPPSPPPPPKLEVRIVKLTSARKAGRWRVIARIAVNKPVSARARVGRQRRTWGDRTVNVRAGTRSLTVPLTRRARRGKCWFRLVARTQAARGARSGHERSSLAVEPRSSRESEPRPQVGASRWKRPSPNALLALAGTIIGLVSGIAGLVFLFNPDLKPSGEAAKEAATLSQLRLRRERLIRRVPRSLRSPGHGLHGRPARPARSAASVPCADHGV